MKINWKIVTRDHVLKAIEKFNTENIKAPKARSTFLLHEGQSLPAKHIRGMAYEIATGIRLSKEDYTGGQETVDFFDRLRFIVRHTPKSRNKDTYRDKMA